MTTNTVEPAISHSTIVYPATTNSQLATKFLAEYAPYVIWLQAWGKPLGYLTNRDFLAALSPYRQLADDYGFVAYQKDFLACHYKSPLCKTFETLITSAHEFAIVVDNGGNYVGIVDFWTMLPFLPPQTAREARV